MSSLTINIGDAIRIGGVDHVVTGYDAQRDVMMTTWGDLHCEDIHRIPPPTGNPEAMERWLNGPSWIAPAMAEIEVRNQACPTGTGGCDCGCYLLVTKADGVVAGEQHFSQNETCRCAR